jgi:hypothetical protein
VRSALLLLFLLAACGGGPRLTNLRCSSDKCQSVEDPLLLLLAVDFSDDSGTLDAGAIDLRLNGNSQRTVSLADIFAAQGIAAGTKKGTLQIDDDIAPERMNQGQQFTVSVVATNGRGHDYNEPDITFTLHLGGP